MRRGFSLSSITTFHLVYEIGKTCTVVLLMPGSNMVNMCTSVDYVCVKFGLKKFPLVIDFFAKQHEGHYLRDTLYV